MKPYDWRPHLEQGEALLWSGRPFPALALIRPTQAEWLIGGLGAVGVAALLVLDRWLSSPAGDPGARAVIFLLLLLGALLVTGWPFRAMRQRSRALQQTAYAVTDRRALIAHQRDTGAFRAYALSRRAQPVLEPGDHGLMTLHFGGDSPRFIHLKDGDRILTAVTAARQAAFNARKTP
ncbi:MAG: hypothetical protein Q4G22_14535 [Paracoccus sp. (in: a-proteobacteria)]|uniref:hypothetical protein n=1 Tax=Paracoccus sp. TaxID=267 RepID=UPI0026E0D836|nr:hypothetical protein [Paracoccus sp. (in: a-proteobacteria)]MDO5633031.1 hypothetical protein [Paracoccus sp. (in: a-proteobacteria)]